MEDKMKLQVTRPGGPWPVAFDGTHIVQVEDGSVHDFPPHIGDPWLERGWAKAPEAPKPVVEAAPENKMEPEVPQVKEPEQPIARPHKRGRRKSK
jgi:hypothetical protein